MFSLFCIFYFRMTCIFTFIVLLLLHYRKNIMKNKTTTIRIPVDIANVISQFAESKKWQQVTALTEIIKTSTMFTEYLEFIEKNSEQVA